jgi:dihydrofolate reductase
MLRCIAALDNRNGTAKDGRIPWQGAIPSDLRRFREHTRNQSVLMGRVTLDTIGHPPVRRTNYVASRRVAFAIDGVQIVPDAIEFAKNFVQDLWVIGGAKIYTETIGLVDELYLTRIQKDFKCDQFFPAFEKDFVQTLHSELKAENGINFRFEVWRRK